MSLIQNYCAQRLVCPLYFLSVFTLIQFLFNFHILVFIMFLSDGCLFYNPFIQITSTSWCCSSHAITFTSLSYFLFFFSTSTKSIFVPHSPALKGIFFFLLKLRVCHAQLFFITELQPSSTFFFLIILPPCTPSYRSIYFLAYPL